MTPRQRERCRRLLDCLKRVCDRPTEFGVAVRLLPNDDEGLSSKQINRRLGLLEFHYSEEINRGQSHWGQKIP